MTQSMLPFALAVSAAMLAVGSAGVMLRRDPLVMFMSVELMLNSVNVALVAFGRFLDSEAGQVFALMVIVVAAAEAVVGLALLTRIFRHGRALDIDDVSEMSQ